MPTKITKPVADHLAFVLARDKAGREWAPRNAEAIVLGTKGAPVGDSPKSVKAAIKKFLIKKGWFLPSEFSYNDGPGYPVSSDVPDDIDGDGDGASDYNDIVSLMGQAFSDLQTICCVSEEATRSAAIVQCVQRFLSALDEIRSGDDADKAGARHSAADKARIAAIADAHGKMAKAVNALTKAHAAIGDNLQKLGDGEPEYGDKTPDNGNEGQPQGEKAAELVAAEKALAEWKAGDLGEDGYPVNVAEYHELREKASKKDGPPKPYGDVEYADEENGKYPIDNEEHARAAWSYINQEKNASEYSAEKLAEVKSKIRAACKKFGIEIDESKAAPADEDEMKPEDVQAMIDKALADKQAEVDAEKARANAAEQAAKDAQATADAAKAAQKKTEAASVALARSVSAISQKGVNETEHAVARKARMTGMVKEALGSNPVSTVI